MTSLCVSFMKYLLIGLLASATMFATQSRQTFSGTITDDECPSADHSGMRMGSTDAACTIACVDDHTVEFVLFDGEASYLLSDQDKSREFAGKKVAVVGTLDSTTWTIQVNSMAAANCPIDPPGIHADFKYFLCLLEFHHDVRRESGGTRPQNRLAGGTRVRASSGVVGIYSAGATIMIWSRAALSAGSSDSPEG